MNKRQQLMESIIQDIIAFRVEETRLSIEQAMHQFYQSQTYDRLADEATGLYLESSSYVYDLFLIEQRNGGLLQMEQ